MGEKRAALSAADRDKLSDSKFAWVDKDGTGHVPISDEGHEQAALGRFGETAFDTDDDKKAAAVAIMAAAKKFGIEVDSKSDVAVAAGVKVEEKTDDAAPCPTCKGEGTIMAGNRECPDCKGSGDAPEGEARQSRASRKPRHRSGLPLGREFRQWSVNELRVSTDSQTGAIQLNGTPIVYGVGYAVRDMFGEFEETMHPGVASAVLARGADVRFLFNHEGMPLARTTSGTLKMIDGPDKLDVRVSLDPRQQLANDLAIAVERGDVNQMSCGFVVDKDAWSDSFDQRDVFRFEEMFDVSAVTYPASPTTSLEMAQRMMAGMPVDSRARVRRVWSFSRDLRAGKVLSSSNMDALTNALEALHQADAAFTALAGVHSALSDAHESAAGSIKTVMDAATPPEERDSDGDDDGDANGTEYQGDADGSDGGMSGSTVSQDGTGSRSIRATSDAGFEPAPYKRDPDEVVTCPQCNKGDSPDARFCDQCGFKLLGAKGVTETTEATEGRASMPATKDERREALMSFGDQQSAVTSALMVRFSDQDGDCDLWIDDLGNDWVVFSSWGDGIVGPGLWRMSYSVAADGVVTLANTDPTPVNKQTSYAPVPPATTNSTVNFGARALELELDAIRLGIPLALGG